jgi:hypothetical protein
MVSNCKSEVCKARLYTVLGEVQKVNQIVRFLTASIEEQRISAARQILHLKALGKYQIDNHLDTITSADIEKLYEEGIVLENPDVDMGDVNDNPTIAGPTSSHQSLTSQSLSFNGFTDSDSDYIP